MRQSHILIAVLAALTLGGCMQRQAQTYYIIDPQTGQPVPVVTPQRQFAQPAYPQQQYAAQTYRQPQQQSLYSPSAAAAQQSYAQPQYAQSYSQPAAAPQAAAKSSSGRGLFTSRRSASPRYAPQPQQYASPQYAAPAAGGPYVAAPGYASASYAPAYTLDSGDKLRVVVFGQDGITNSYTVDAGGNVNLPLIGTVPARGYSTQQLSGMIAERLKQGYVREPHVSVEVEGYRPFFILGEVTNPGQYPYVANMTVEAAVAIAGGFGPRAAKGKVELTRNSASQRFHGDVPLNYPLSPGDTVVIKERWF